MSEQKKMKPIVVLHPSCMTAKSALLKAGYLVVFAEDPSHVAVVTWGAALVSPDAILVAAAQAIQKADQSEGPRTRFGRYLAEQIIDADKAKREQPNV